jgi:hypothetical protein
LCTFLNITSSHLISCSNIGTYKVNSVNIPEREKGKETIGNKRTSQRSTGTIGQGVEQNIKEPSIKVYIYIYVYMYLCVYIYMYIYTFIDRHVH